jgi:hypothetical protein
LRTFRRRKVADLRKDATSRDFFLREFLAGATPGWRKGRRYCAPFSLQAVEQVVMTPFLQAMHTATHCSKSFAL